MEFYNFEAERLDGTTESMKTYKGKTIIVVNTASKCGLTPQYEGLEDLYTKYKDQGLVVLGFPCNQFGNQEPGDANDIKEFCQINYGVSFPMFAKIDVNGEGRHPLYRYLVEHQPVRETLPDGQLKPNLLKAGLLPEEETEVLWNFEKFLVDRQGLAIARFSPDITVEHPSVLKAIEKALHQEAQMAS